MKLTGCTSYSKIMWLMCSGPRMEAAIENIRFSTPNFGSEGYTGAILVDYEMEVKDLKALANIFEGYYSLANSRRQNLEGLVRGLGDCK